MIRESVAILRRWAEVAGSGGRIGVMKGIVAECGVAG